MIDAVVLAGGPQDDVSRLQRGAPNKAFVEIAGITLIGRVLRSLRESHSIGRIVVVAPITVAGRADLAYADELRPDGVRITESLRNGLNGFNADRHALVVASDLPILSGAALDDFIERLSALGADIAYGCVEKGAHLRKYPNVPHTWARMRDGTFCGGGIVGIKPRVLPMLEHFIERLGAARKHPFRLASLFGWDMLVRFALGRLAIKQAEERATKILGAPVRALVSPFPETAVNVDRVTDVAVAEGLIKESASA